MNRPAVLVIAGSDSSGGAGLSRDVRTLTELGADALCVVTAVTAQSQRRVASVHQVPPAILRAQIDAVFETRPPGAIKIGMLGSRATVEAVADGLEAAAGGLEARGSTPMILDPVLAASSGGILLDAAGRVALCERLLPRAALITPNVLEAAALLGEEPAVQEAELRAQAIRLLDLGAEAVLLKGGHGSGEEAVDWLVSRDRPPERIASPRIRVELRGTGCALASAIAAQLAYGAPLSTACRRAQEYVVAQLRAAASDPTPGGR